MDEMTWRKASRSDNGGNCVEVGQAPASPAVGLRDSKRRDVCHIVVTAAAFAAFLADVKAGEYEGRLENR
jgi:hypothetical protein